MLPLKLITLSLLLMILSPMASASFNLNIKIGQLVGNRIVEVNKTIQADYNKEIIISSEGLKNKIVLNLKKFTNVLVNGNKISPIQVDMKLINDMKTIIGKPQTVTSFYNRSAQFAVRTSGVATDVADLNLSLNFEENN
ncbi:MAG: hypothetical protein Q7U04_07665 [Bacteriovorax sp.]|nr:hypothetical protein [Bacteriovorax sp.]